MLLFSYNSRRFEKKLMGAVWAHVKLMVTQNSLTKLKKASILESFERARIFCGVSTIL